MTTDVEQLDTTIEIVTPENVLLKSQIAGPFRRGLAHLIDLVLLVSLFGAISLLIQATYGNEVVMMAALITMFFLTWFSFPCLELYWNGQTPGKRALSIRVLSADGRPIDGMQAVLRNLLRVVDFLPFGYLTGFLATTMNKRFQRLGDLASVTIVVIDESHRNYGLAKIKDPLALQLASELPANIEISRSLGKALSSYVERRKFFSPPRREDIARHVGQWIARRYGLPPDTSNDLLLCALYYRCFVTDMADEEAYEIASSPMGSTMGGMPGFPAPVGEPHASVDDLSAIQITPSSSRTGGSA